MSMYNEPQMAGPMGEAKQAEGKPKLRVSAMMTSGFPGEDNKSWMKERHARLKKEIAATEQEITNWDAEAVAAQALRAIKADLARLKGDLLSCEAEMDEAGDESYGDEEGDEEAAGDDSEEADSEVDTEDDSDGATANEKVIAKGNPYSIVKRDGKFVIENNETGKVKGTHTSRKSAMKQFRLLEGIEHGWTPTGKE